MSSFTQKLSKMPPEFQAAMRKDPQVDAMMKGKEIADRIKKQFQSSAKGNAESPSPSNQQGEKL